MCSRCARAAFERCWTSSFSDGGGFMVRFDTRDLAHPSRLEIRLAKARVRAHLLGEPVEVVRLGRFELQHKLGRGATGTVYQARDLLDGREVAVKLLRHPYSSAIEEFKGEFRSAGRMVHENLVNLHELFCEDGEWYFSMDLVHGEPFTRYLRGIDDPNLREARLEDCLRQLLSAVQALHGGGQLHRDLKPANVLVTRAGRVVALDFGLMAAHAARRSIATGEALGTRPYIAPEVEAGGAATPANDVYAVGVMLFEALTGRPLGGDENDEPASKPLTGSPIRAKRR